MFFISYKSENAIPVRMIAELLRSQKISVWFAEYAIPWSMWPDPQPAINDGIEKAKYAIFFTNDSFCNSTYCQYEVAELFKRLPLENIIEIAFPYSAKTHLIFPELSKVRSISVSHPHGNISIDDANRILDFIAKAAGIKINNCFDPEPYSSRLQLRSHGIHYSIDFGGWMVHYPTLQQWWRALPDKIIIYEKSPDKNVTIWGHLISGRQDITRIQIGKIDDREYYKETLKFANSYFGVKRYYKAGIHLMFIEGFGHPSFTTIRKERSKMDQMALIMGEETWSRVYSVVLRNIEFAFFFFLRGSQESFYRYAHLMDRLVFTLRLES